MTPKLSILICSLPNRLKKFSLIEELTRQAKGKPVEILYLGDNKSMTVGEKRNWLVKMAKGERIAFADDDDRVTGDYVDSLLKAHNENPGADVICFEVMVTGYNPKPKRCKYSLFFGHKEGPNCYYRLPNHLMAWRIGLVDAFPEINNGEDTKWANRMCKSARMGGKLTEHIIPQTLYYYDFDPKGTEAQK